MTKIDYRLLEESNMTRDGQIGVPVDPEKPSKGLRWKKGSEVTDDDRKKINEYFTLKANQK